jgi:hypothetical protein
MRVCGQHANLLREVFEPGRLLGGVGEDQSLLRHGAGVMGCIKLFMQDFNSRSELGGFLIELAEASDLPSQPPVVKVADVALEVYEVAAGSDEEGAEPGREWLNRVFLAMPNSVSLRIQIDNIGGLIRALVRVEPGDASVLELFDPFRRFEDSLAQGNEEVGDSSLVLNVPVGGAFEYVFIVFDPVVESGDLLLEATYFDVVMGVASGDGCEEPFDNGSEDVSVEVRVCRQCVRNGIGRHRWFRTLDRADRERDAVLNG